RHSGIAKRREKLHVKIQTVIRTLCAGALAVGALGVSVPSASADLEAGIGGTQVVECTGTQIISSLNPTIKDGNATNHFARYIKTAVKKSDGTKTFLGGVPVPVDATTCTVDAGIRTNQPSQDIKYT